MSEHHDVQAMSNREMHVYEAVASVAVEGNAAELADLVRMTGLGEEEVRRSLATLVATGHVLPRGTGFALGGHTFEVDY